MSGTSAPRRSSLPRTIARIALPRHRVAVGWLSAAFLVAIFPGNIAQYGRSFRLLNTDHCLRLRRADAA